MKLLGNIITALICLTSFGFFFVSLIVVASHSNWKEIAFENKEIAEGFRSDRQTAVEEVARIKSLLERYRLVAAHEISITKSQLELLREQYNQAREAGQKAQTDLNLASANLQQTIKKLNEKDTENARVRQQVVALSQDLSNQVAKIALLQSELEQTRLLHVRTDREVKEQMKRFNQLKLAAKSVGVDENTLKTVIPPDLNGRVTGISPSQKGVFTLSFGEDDGLRVGHSVDVVRNGRHIGTAKVILAKANNATAKFLIGRQNEQAQIDDKVTTVLSKKFPAEKLNHVTTK